MSKTRTSTATITNKLFSFVEVQRWPLVLTDDKNAMEIRETAGEGCGEAMGWERSVLVSLPEGEVRSYQYVHDNGREEEKILTGKFAKSGDDFRVQMASDKCRHSMSILLKERLGEKAAPVVAAVCSEYDVVHSLKTAGCVVGSPIQERVYNNEKPTPGGRCVIS